MLRLAYRARSIPVVLSLLSISPVVGKAEEGRISEAGELRPPIYLVAARQKPRIAASLRRAGISPVADILETSSLLRVTVGDEKGFRSCGTRNNVKYQLRVDGATVLELKDDGWTGSCEPNVFDILSAQLAHEMSERDRGGEQQ